ncbi:MAG TPA: ABC transporter permease [Rhodopila sp.]|uniref:ABC transporter permease n=1 Tax=Rhodopila sp. TaxID=2480087 RepID=UPI002C78325C|nr:ABC transporter permease [Rhodopila sp.]HVY17707.1 ABC transporter permease [Rhodopila sp.]
MNGRAVAASLALRTVTGLTFLFIAAPLVVTMALSISDTRFVAFPPKGFTLSWFGNVVANPDFRSSLYYSLWLAASATAGALLLGMPAALALVRFQVKGSAALRSLLLSPLVFPVLITGLALLQLFSMMGWQVVWRNLLIAHILVTFPYVVRTVSASLILADVTLEEAARTLGASRWRAFVRVTLPQIAPGVVAGALFAFMVSFDNFPVSMWLADAANDPMPMFIYRHATGVFDPSVAATSTLMIGLAIVVVLAIERLVGLKRAMGI